jgi:hypothetical protein
MDIYIDLHWNRSAVTQEYKIFLRFKNGKQDIHHSCKKKPTEMALRDKIASLYLMGKNDTSKEAELHQMMRKIVQSDNEVKTILNARASWNKILGTLSNILPFPSTTLNVDSNSTHDRLRESCLNAYFECKREKTEELVSLYLSQDLETEQHSLVSDTVICVIENIAHVGLYLLNLWTFTHQPEYETDEDEKETNEGKTEEKTAE